MHSQSVTGTNIFHQRSLFSTYNNEPSLAGPTPANASGVERHTLAGRFPTHPLPVYGLVALIQTRSFRRLNDRNQMLSKSCLQPNACVRAARPAFKPVLMRSPVMKTMRPSSISALQDCTNVAYPPHMPLAGCEPGSFAEGTISKRLPAILESMLKDMEAVAQGTEHKDALPEV
eukprot:gene11370-12066_t